MAITIQCPNPECRARASVPEGASGRGVKCKRCGTAFVAQATVVANPGETQASRPSAAAGDPFPTLPAEFGRYRVLKLLGRGGMGAVYLAEDSQLGRRVALKLPSFGAGASDERVERFLREARSAAALHHPNICTLYDAGREGDRPYLTMAYLEGRSLAEALDPDRPLSQREAAALARKVAEALGHAHERGVVHRDLKPANVMLTAAGEPVVMDFGLAKRLAETDAREAKLTRVGAVMGTPDYMAPEQVRGETDRIGPHTDVYALGVLLFELLTGRPSYEGHVGAVMGQILAAPVPSVRELRPDVDERLEAICRRAMAKEPGARFPSMAAFAEALGQYLASARKAKPAANKGPEPFRDLTEPTPRRRPRARTAGRPARWPLLIGAGAAGLVLLLAALGVVLLTVRTKYGDVVVELSDPAAQVEVKVDGEKIDLVGPVRPVSLTVGEHGLTVTGADFETVTKAFTIRQGEKQVVKVTLRPKLVAGGGLSAGTPPGTTETRTPPPQPVPLTQKTDDGWVSLFNGKDLTGWEGLKENWSVKEGAIVGSTAPAGLKGGFNTFLCSQKKYKDFELSFQVKLTGTGWSGNSGVQIRSEVDDPVHLAVKGPQCDMGDIYWGSLYGERFGGMMKQAPREVVEKVLKKDDFNDYSIKVVGKHVTIKLNGQTTVDDDFDKLPAEGVIALQLHQGNAMEVIFKDFKFKDLSPAPTKAETLPGLGAAAEDKGFVPLFNGKDLKGWKTHPSQPGNWRVEKGILIGSSDGVSHLYTERGDYMDFQLRLEARVNDGGNSGVYFRGPFGPNLPTASNKPTWIAAYNAKIHAPRFGGLLIEPNSELHRTRETVLKPGEWLTFEIRAEGNHLVIQVNGQTTADYTDEKRCFDRGHVALQQHGPKTVCEFRKIEIKELPNPSADK
jgi:hypothetical protein